MRPEKQFLVDEVASHLEKSDYVFLTDFVRITVAETADLRDRLSPHGAEFHVIKNSILNVAAKQRDMPDLSPMLDGPTAIIVGGNNAPEVAKILLKYYKEKDKLVVKGGALGANAFGPDDVKALSDMPPLEVVQAQLLGLLSQPGTQLARLLNVVPEQMVTVLAAVPRSVLNILNAKKGKDEAA